MKLKVQAPDKLSQRHKKIMMVVGILLGIIIGTLTIFTVLFMAKVLPHGGF